MKKKFFFSFIFSITILALVSVIAGCSPNDRDGNVWCDDVIYVSEFPRIIEVDTLTPLSVNLTGSWTATGIDSIMIGINRSGHRKWWNIHSVPALDSLCSLFSEGHGPNEYEDFPMPSVLSIRNDSIYCDIWDSWSETMATYNLTACIDSGHPIAVGVHKIDVRPNTLYCYPIEGDSLLGISRAEDGLGHVRHIITPNGTRELNVGNLNTVRATNDINAIGSVKNFNRRNGMMVEAMIMMNQINIYSVNSPFSATICTGDRLRKITEADTADPDSHREFYSNVYTCDNYFAALLRNVSASDFKAGKGSCRVQFFDWKGAPLLELRIPQCITSFFISGDNLYLFSSAGDKELLYRYDLPKVI